MRPDRVNRLLVNVHAFLLVEETLDIGDIFAAAIAFPKHTAAKAELAAALSKHVRKLPQELRRSLAWDRGKEMADHKSFTIATNLANTSPIIVYQSRAK
jgi:hypothetical protein